MAKGYFFDFYKESHEINPFKIEFTPDDLARLIVSHNYGCHRMVCALADAQKRKFPNSKLAELLEDAASQEVI